MALRKNEAGFTFISLLTSLMIIMITMPLLIFFISQIKAESYDGYIQAHQFFVFLKMDTEKAEMVSITDGMLYFELSTGETARIESYENQIRRRVRKNKVFEGHEIYLRAIRSVSFTPLSYGYQVNLIMENGEHYEKKIAF